MSTELDVCRACGREVRFGERQHHLDEACVPETVVRPPGFAGRLPPSPWVMGVDHAEKTYWSSDSWGRFDAQRKSSRR